MNTIHYMWRFKLNETKRFPKNVIDNNSKFIEKFDIATPSLVQHLLETNNDTFPNLLELYNNIPHWVTKSDIGRLLIIYFHGGIYSDADCFIKKSFNSHRETDNIILFTEHFASLKDFGPRECKNPENSLRIANFFFGCNLEKHPFLKEVIDECINRLKQMLIVEKNTNLSQSDILWICGPDVITTVYHRSKNNYTDIFLYDNTFLEHKSHGSWR